jgi:hypothetical protein
MKVSDQYLLCKLLSTETNLSQNIYRSLLFLKKRFKIKGYDEIQDSIHNNYNRNCENLKKFITSIIIYYPKIPKHELYIISYNLYKLHSQHTLQDLFQNDGLEYKIQAINEVYILYKEILLKYSSTKDLRIKKIQLAADDSYMKLSKKILAKILPPRLTIRTMTQYLQTNSKESDPCFQYKPYNIVPSFALEYIAHLVEIFKQGQNINKQHFAYQYFEKLHKDILLNKSNAE